MKPLDAMGDDELLGKISGIFKIGYVFVPLVLRRINPLKTLKLVRLGWSLKGNLADLKSTSNEKRIDAGVNALEEILDFRRNNKEEFDEILDILEDITQEYKKNPEYFKNAIVEILDD